MKIMKTKTQEVYSLFYGNDNLRPTFHNPLIWENKVYATDAHCLIITEKENIDFEFENEYKGHDLSTILPPVNTSEFLIIPELESLKTAEETKEVGQDIKCKECGGDGEVEWEYEKWTKYDDCPKCNGDGYEENTKEVLTGNKTFRNIIVKVKKTYFQIKLFNKIFETQKVLGGKIELISYSEAKNCMFKIGDFEILLMAYKVGSESDKEILTIETK